MISDTSPEETDDRHDPVFATGREARASGIALCRGREPAVEADPVSRDRHEDPAGGHRNRTPDRALPLAAGAELSLHEHVEIEQTFVLEGSLVDDEGEVRAGNYVWRPKGNRHIARSPNGALVLSMFLKPNIFLAGDAAGRDLR